MTPLRRAPGPGGEYLPSAAVRIALTHAFSSPEVRRGAERFLPALAAALARRGHEVLHLTAAWNPSRGGEGGVRTVKLRRWLRDDRRHEADFGRRVVPYLARERFDAVHSLGRHDAVGSIRAARLRRDGRRTVFTDLGFPDRAWWREQGRREERAMARVAEAIDVYSAMSRTAIAALEPNFGRSDGVVVPGGVDLDTFRPAPEREASPTILFSGAIDEPRKGVACLLHALPLIVRREPGVMLWLSGPGNPDPLLQAAPAEVRARVRPLGLGKPERQHERYGRAWITCLPSRADSFGMAVLESLACGTPVVSTTDGAPRELVRAGVTGALCDPDDPESLACACLRAFALAQLPQTVGECRRDAEPFDWDLGLAPLCERLYSGIGEGG